MIKLVPARADISNIGHIKKACFFLKQTPIGKEAALSLREIHRSEWASMRDS
jgi:hypothetical protein